MRDTNVVRFPIGSAGVARLVKFDRRTADADKLAAELGTPEEWLDTAIAHLRLATGGRKHGSTTVSVAAIHLALARIEWLEAQLGIAPNSGPEAA